MENLGSSTVYIQVIEDVINRVREEFVNDGGPEESVLNELQGLWEIKMMQTDAVCHSLARSSTLKSIPGGPGTPFGDFNLPYEANEEYETPTADIFFSPTPLDTSIQTPLPGSVENHIYNIFTGTSDSSAVNDNGSITEVKAGMPSPYMPPPSHWMNLRPPLDVDVNVAYVEVHEEVDRGISDQSMPQQAETRSACFAIPNRGTHTTAGWSWRYFIGVAFQKSQESRDWSPSMPQLDGSVADPYDNDLSTSNIYNYQEVVNEDYSIVNTQSSNGSIQIKAGEEDDSKLSLNEDDDDDLDDVDPGEELQAEHLVLAQFDKVTRAKNRWKCTLKSGIMNINNKDVLFNKANAEFDF